MNQTRTLILSLIIRQRQRRGRAFSSALTPRVHVPRHRGSETSRPAPSSASPAFRTTTAVATATPP